MTTTITPLQQRTIARLAPGESAYGVKIEQPLPKLVVLKHRTLGAVYAVTPDTYEPLAYRKGSGFSGSYITLVPQRNIGQAFDKHDVGLFPDEDYIVIHREEGR